MVLVTSVPDGGNLATLLVTREGAWRTSAPAMASRAKGAGDFLAACWLGTYLTERDPVAALQWAASATDTLIGHAAAEDAAELPLIAAQAAWAAPDVLLPVSQIDP